MDPDLVIDHRLRFTLKLLKLPSEHPMCKCTTNAATACECLGTPVKDYQGTLQPHKVLLILQVLPFAIQAKSGRAVVCRAGQAQRFLFWMVTQYRANMVQEQSFLWIVTHTGRANTGFRKTFKFVSTLIPKQAVHNVHNVLALLKQLMELNSSWLLQTAAWFDNGDRSKVFKVCHASCGWQCGRMRWINR